MHGVIRAAVVLGLVAPLLGCSGADDAAGDCLTAFREIDPRAEPPYGASPLDDAVRRCRSLAAWRDAWGRVPEAHDPSHDADEFLRGRCAVEELAATELCREILGSS